MSDATVTPKHLAHELGVSQRAVRNYLRNRYGTLPPFETRWHLDPARADDVRSHFNGATT